MKKNLIDFYLSYVNDYLTVARMAEDHGISEDECSSLIEWGKMYHEERAKNFKYTITYIIGAKVFRETIKDSDWASAKDVCKTKGEFVSCICVE